MGASVVCASDEASWPVEALAITHPKHGPGQRPRQKGQPQGAGDGAPGHDDGRGVDGDVVEGELVVRLVDGPARPSGKLVQEEAVDGPLLGWRTVNDEKGEWSAAEHIPALNE